MQVFHLVLIGEAQQEPIIQNWLVRLADQGVTIDSRGIKTLEELDERLTAGRHTWQAALLCGDLPGLSVMAAFRRVAQADETKLILMPGDMLVGEDLAGFIQAGGYDVLYPTDLEHADLLVARMQRAIERRLTWREFTTRSNRTEGFFRATTGLVCDYAYVARVDFSGNMQIEWDNDGAEELLGYTSAELHAMGGVMAVVLPADQPMLQAHLARLVSGQNDQAELRVVTRDGMQVWVRHYGRAEVNPLNGKVERLYGALQETSGYHQTTDSLAYRLGIEKLITNILARLIDPPMELIDAEITRALQEMGEFIGVDDCFMRLFNDETGQLEKSITWHHVQMDGRDEIPLDLSQ